ncbi:hypothetical protein HMPREF0762_00651 [Slackia exigua ATCC 700122]|uniref:Uncharacterized protein n=1 Tax=Slackia exigua (strain ATCC 700122 / DSM 15923 / CIP 105133 / JCM 11022 / KCTC 5966 / S-7) TaxID=649764 RepID=D0WFQ2_SLAES|nr:hypothetical protein HMPREF0762_00651 [Slackia exigua ATCC 700122]
MQGFLGFELLEKERSPIKRWKDSRLSRFSTQTSMHFIRRVAGGGSSDILCPLSLERRRVEEWLS